MIINLISYVKKYTGNVYLRKRLARLKILREIPREELKYNEQEKMTNMVQDSNLYGSGRSVGWFFSLLSKAFAIQPSRALQGYRLRVVLFLSRSLKCYAVTIRDYFNSLD
jgi:hypothetical protein